MTFQHLQRQVHLDEQSYLNTIAHFRSDARIAEDKLLRQASSPKRQRGTLVFLAANLWSQFQLRYTAGDALTDLADFLTVVVEGYERAAETADQVPESDYVPVFTLNDPMDEYVDYIGLLSAAVLLHREDLIPRLHQLLAGTDFDEADLLIEELLNFCLPGRPIVDQWFWDKPYGMLVEVIDSETSAAKVNAMKKYVKKWYSSMKGQAHLWGKHEKTTPEYSQYVGYWAFCAAAFTYLYDLDDSTYRDELVYPKDLVDYARSVPRQLVTLNGGVEVVRTASGGTKS